LFIPFVQKGSKSFRVLWRIGKRGVIIGVILGSL
jgi:hypothetical protein